MHVKLVSARPKSVNSAKTSISSHSARKVALDKHRAVNLLARHPVVQCLQVTRLPVHHRPVLRVPILHNSHGVLDRRRRRLGSALNSWRGAVEPRRHHRLTVQCRHPLPDPHVEWARWAECDRTPARPMVLLVVEHLALQQHRQHRPMLARRQNGHRTVWALA